MEHLKNLEKKSVLVGATVAAIATAVGFLAYRNKAIVNELKQIFLELIDVSLQLFEKHNNQLQKLIQNPEKYLFLKVIWKLLKTGLKMPIDRELI